MKSLNCGDISCNIKAVVDSILPDAEVSDDAPTLGEVHDAILKLKNGADGIPEKPLKYALEPVAVALNRIFYLAWKIGRIPSDWRDRCIVVQRQWPKNGLYKLSTMCFRQIFTHFYCHD